MQARTDARTAVAHNQSLGEGLRPEDRSSGLLCAYLRLGQALLADPKHADRDCCQAVKVCCSFSWDCQWSTITVLKAQVAQGGS